MFSFIMTESVKQSRRLKGVQWQDSKTDTVYTASGVVLPSSK